jgi:hypothetical protein
MVTHATARRVLAIVPSLDGLPRTMLHTLEHAGFSVVVSPTLDSVDLQSAGVLLINVAGFGSRGDWEAGIRRTVDVKQISMLRDTPSVVIDPPQEWSTVGWGGSAVEAYYRVGSDPQILIDIVQQLL